MRDNNACDRFPLLTEAGAQLLERLQEHPSAPCYTHPGCDRVTPAGLRRMTAFAQALQDRPPAWRPGEVPAWLANFVAHCYAEVPFYRRWGPPPAGFFDLPFTTRLDLNREPWAFVPDAQSLEDLIVYNTSGTTGHPLDILTHPDVLALYLPLLQVALRVHGLTLEGRPGRVAIVLVCAQQRTYTYAAVSAGLNQAGFIKVNLRPDQWRQPGDAALFLDDCEPEVYTGDPLAFAELAKLSLHKRPKALVSTAMTLAPGMKQALEAHFGCPVLDMYSLNETGPVAVAADSGYRLLQPELYVEVLNEAGAPCAPGERGEVVMSGGLNPFLPLLRYRTGDMARLEFRGAQPQLVDLAGRPPVTFRAANGQRLNNIDVSLALRDFAIAQYTLHQARDGALRLRVYEAAVDPERLRAALRALFGPDQALTIEALEAELPGGKVIQYACDLDED